MGLSPVTADFLEQALSDAVEANENEVIKTSPTKTYRFDFETGELTKYIDEEPAIRQFVRKALMTSRFRYIIYSDDYGNELIDLIGEDVSRGYIETEAPRMIEEALIYDDRVEEVTDFQLEFEGDKLYIDFKVVFVDGYSLIMQEEVELP